MTNISDSAGTTIVSCEYDAECQRKKRTLENATVAVYDYDNAGQMTNIVHKKTDETPISSYAYGYDDAGQRKWVKRGSNEA